MNPLNENEIRKSFVNASRREASQATLPDLSSLDWDALDYLGWCDEKRPLSYAVVEIEGVPTGILLRTTVPAKGARRARAMCTWCEDVVETGNVSMYVARRAGASGRRGNTIGTLICTEFGCSRNVRRKPTVSEVGSDDDADRTAYTDRRIAGLRERSVRFIASVLETSSKS
ncbi:FBP domain-containing protein [Luteipulveratus mongoliensis]|uniref:Translation elongation factor n=1 Tax=Luteipulveratus mongoliensis TaxID=571913 RepID=A0A0K1JPT6_9MICO|nr:FBP domain-containing protein [Luteipulveratus mongoliensis]AKU18590.1 translation elongation factor [Luteipulveratus mongoliensis]